MTKFLAVFNFILIAFFLVDTYIAKPTRIREIYLKSTSEVSRTRRRTYTNQFVISVSGHKYEIPDHVSTNFNEGDTFFINKSRLLHRPLQIIFSDGVNTVIIDNGLINEKISVKLMICFILIISVLNFSKNPFIKNREYNDQLIYVTSFFTAVIIFFYFYQ